MIQSACPCAPTPQFTHCVTNPYCPGARTGQSLMSWRGGLCVSWHCATFYWQPDWGQRGRLLRLRLMGTGLWSGCRVLQNRHPAGTSCPLCRTPPVLHTRLIGTPNCPYEYFRAEQEWEFRAGGLVSRALTANDPLNDQRKSESRIQEKDAKDNKNDQFLTCATFLSMWSVFSFLLICR